MIEKIIEEILTRANGIQFWIFVFAVMLALAGWYYIGKSNDNDKKRTRIQLYFVIIVVVIALFALFIQNHIHTKRYSFGNDETGVLVMRITNDNNNDIQRFLTLALTDSLKNDKIIVRRHPKNIREDMGLCSAHRNAKKIGKSNNALLVIWGEATDNKIFFPRITLIQEVSNFTFQNDLELRPQKFESTTLTLPEELITKPTLLTNFLVGYKIASEGFYDRSLEYLYCVLEDTISNVVNRKDILTIISNIHSYIWENDKSKHEHFEKSVKLLRRILCTDSLQVEAFNLLGNRYSSYGSFEEAIVNYNKAIEIDSSFHIAYYNLGIVYANQGKHEKAIEQFNKSLQLNNEYKNAYIWLGLIRKWNGDFESAVKDFTKAIQIDPKCGIAYVNRGNTYKFQNQFSKALRDYTRAIKYHIDPSNAYLNRGSLYFQRKYYSRAINDFTHAIELDSIDYDAFSFRASSYFALNKYVKSKLDYKKVLQLHPENFEAYYGMAKIDSIQGNVQQSNINKMAGIQFELKFLKEYYKKPDVYNNLKLRVYYENLIDSLSIEILN
mgnify:CR=1 FL=1